MAESVAAIKSLLMSRGFTAIALGTLTTGYALVATMLGVVNAYLLRPLPYPAADRLFRVDYAAPGQSFPRGMEALEWSQLADVVELSISWDLDVFYLLGREYPESAPGAWVTPGYLSGLGVRIGQGRTFTPDDYSPSNPPVALISHRLWQRRFGGDPAVIGSTFNAYVSDRPDEPETFTVIGVLAPDLWHVNIYSEVLTPLKAPSYPYQVRLRDGVTPTIVADRIDRLVRAGISNLPPQYGVRLTGLQESYVSDLKPVLWSVLSGAALVLLIATANVVVLMIARVRHREREIGVRLALGASMSRVLRMLAWEGVLVTAVSTVLGLLVAWLVLPNVAAVVETVLQRRVPSGAAALNIDLRVVLMVAACGALVAAVIASVPALTAWSSRAFLLAVTFGRGLTDSVRTSRARTLLIAVEVATSLTLLVGASLLSESAIHMLQVDFGFRTGSLVTASLALRQRSMPTESDRAQFFERLEDELRNHAGNEVAALGDWWPLQGSRPRRVETSGGRVAGANPFAVSPGYFDALGIRVRNGRAFTRSDRLGSEPVAIVSASLADRLWPEASAVGQTLTLHSDDDRPTIARTVVGVVNDVRQSHDDADLSDVYLPLAQRAERFAFIYLRQPPSATWEADVRAAITRIHPEVAMGTPRRLEEGLEQERVRPQFLAYLLAAFALFASALALVGMYGVIAYAVRQRQREIALRIALGADSGMVMAIFLRYAALVLTLGLAAGLAGASGLGRVLQSQLFEVRPVNARTLAGAVILFITCALPAILWPAWRATTLDPGAVLKQE